MDTTVPSTGCPDPVELEKLAEGRTVDGRIAEHARSCAACSKALAKLCGREVLLLDMANMGKPNVDRSDAGPQDELNTESISSPSLDLQNSAIDGRSHFIGPYKLLELIGEGGFGSVYMAEQERPVRRRVALKIIKLGMDTRKVIARFEQERQAIALMDHPNIAKVLDAGATTTGRPYFVMELVRGESITQYCDRAKLTVRERLELFSSVCHAVQHAHTKGIIHRDIKPSNVLVTVVDSKPVPKVIDFGIAKATAGPLTDKTLFTEHRQMIGTPEYMSPEQAEMTASDIDTRSDVYSLGVLLYELLTGVTPFDSQRLRSAAWGEMQRIIREDDPPRPSTRLTQLTQTRERVATDRRVSPDRLGTIVRGDLDWIAMKCLEKDRTRRYETASALADDIDRYLVCAPVLAAPPSALYRGRKFVHRYRKGLIVTAVVAATGMVAIGVAINSAFAGARASERMREATHQQELAERLSERSIEVVANPFEERELPRLRAEWSSKVEEFRAKNGPDDPRTIRAEALLVLLDWTAMIKAAAVGGGETRLAEIQRLSKPLLAIRQRARGVLPIDDAAWVGLANAATQAALFASGTNEEVDACYKDLWEALSAAFGPEDPTTLQMQLQRASMLAKGPSPEPVLELLRSYVEIRQRANVGASLALDREHERLLTALSRSGMQFDAAAMGPFMKIYYEDSQAVYSRNSAPRLQGALAYAIWLADQNSYADAEKVCAEAHESGPSDASTASWHALILWHLGFATLHMGQAQEAEPILHRAAETIANYFGKDGYLWFRAIGGRGEALTAIGSYAAAEPLLLEAQRGMSELHNSDGMSLEEIERERASGIPRLVALYEKWGKVEEANRWRQKAHSFAASPALLFWEATKATSKKQAEAVDQLLQVAEGLAEQIAPDHPHRIIVERVLALALNAAGRHDEARRRVEEDLASLAGAFGKEHSAVLRMRVIRAEVLASQGDEAGARLEFESVIADIERTQKPYSRAALSLTVAAAQFFEDKGPQERATEWRQRADSWNNVLPPAPRNLDFEEGDESDSSPGWMSPALSLGVPDFAWVSSQEPYHGARCVIMSTLDGFSSIPATANAFRNIMQSFDATAWAGKRVRLSAAIRAACPDASDSAAMWLRVDMKAAQKPSFLSDMSDRPIRTDEWKVYEIVADIAEDAQKINIGVMAFGGAIVRIDDVRFEEVPSAR